MKGRTTTQDFPVKQKCVSYYASSKGVLKVLLVRDDSHYLSKDMFVLYYVLISSQKNIKFSTSKLRNKWTAHCRCALKERQVSSYSFNEENRFLWISRHRTISWTCNPTVLKPVYQFILGFFRVPSLYVC